MPSYFEVAVVLVDPLLEYVHHPESNRTCNLAIEQPDFIFVLQVRLRNTIPEQRERMGQVERQQRVRVCFVQGMSGHSSPRATASSTVHKPNPEGVLGQRTDQPGCQVAPWVCRMTGMISETAAHMSCRRVPETSAVPQA